MATSSPEDQLVNHHAATLSWTLSHNARFKVDNEGGTVCHTEGDENHNFRYHTLKTTLPKLLCLKKLDENENASTEAKLTTLSALNLNRAYYWRDDSQEKQNNNRKKQGYQNVDEALSSLLWQPYEYQKKRRIEGGSSSAGSSPCSSCSCSGTEDGSLGRCSMVNNPALRELATSYAEAFHEVDPSRGDGEASRLSAVSPIELCSTLLRAGTNNTSELCDVNNEASVMQLEVSGSVSSTTSPPPGVGGTIRFDTNLSAANVVGLPNHSRYASVPAVFPRNAPEPSTTFRYPPNLPPLHLRSSSVPKSMPIRSEVLGTTTTTTIVPSPQHSRMGSEVAGGGSVAQNISNVNVNFYRAVPVNVVSSVPTIHCLNTLNAEGNNVSNVQIMPLSSNVQVTVNSPQSIQIPANSSSSSYHPRTFTSTEAQTDDLSPTSTTADLSLPAAATREQRRRERRERRHQRRVTNVNHRHTVDTSTQATENVPDLLNNHLPPPYSTLPSAGQTAPPPIVETSSVAALPPPPPPPTGLVPPPHVLHPHHPHPHHHPHSAVLQTVVPNSVVPSGFAFPPPPAVIQAGHQVAPVAVTAVPPPTGFRFPFPASGFRRGRFSEEPPKSCCGLLSWKPGSLRWFIALIALVAVCCVLVGTALGAMRPAGRDHLTVSLLMIGVGIVLVTVSGVAWRLTSHDSSTCRSMLGLGSTESVDVCARRFVPRLPPSYGRPHHPYAAMMYPEFQYRPPPPSYQASMQEYRLRLLLLDRGNTPQIQAGIQNAVSPPPTYRSHAGSLLRAPLSNRREGALSEYSCPPSYRSQHSAVLHRALPNASDLHSREQSLSLSESNNGESVVNVVNILGSTEEDIALDNITLDSLKMEPENDLNPLRMLLKGSSSDLEGSKDGNLVTIVQTSDQSPVIVTVSGSSQLDNNSTVQITEIPSEMEILAHL